MRSNERREELRPLGQTPRQRPVAEQVDRLVTEYREAARLEDNDRHLTGQRLAKRSEDSLEVLATGVEETKVVERPATACLWRDDDVVAESLENRDSRTSHCWIEVV